MCLGMARVATQVRRRVACLDTTRVSNSGKVSGNDLGKDAEQDKTCKTGRFLCFGVNPS
jgi:hypothetical protein